VQLEFDFDPKLESAAKNDERLEAVGVSAMRRAVIWLFQLHPEAKRDGTLIRLDLSFIKASQWLRNQARWRNLRCADTNVRRACVFWQQLHCVAILKRPRVLLLDVARLSEWLYREQEAVERAVSSALNFAGDGAPPKTNPTRSDPIRPASTLSERVSEEKTHSLTHSVGGVDRSDRTDQTDRTDHPSAPAGASVVLPRLPVEVWEPGRDDRSLYRLLRAYWTEHGPALEAAGIDADTFTGAVLAARAQPRTDPQRYAERCLELGLTENWLAQGRAWRRRQKILFSRPITHGAVQ